MAAEDAQSDGAIVSSPAALAKQAKQQVAEGNLTRGVDLWAKALEEQVKTVGDMDPGAADYYFGYGEALFELTLASADLFGSAVKEAHANAIRQRNEEEQDQSAENDVPDDNEYDVEDLNDQEEKDENLPQLAQQPEEVDDDTELAWELLETARVLFSRQKGDVARLQLAKAHAALGDVATELENFEGAIEDYTRALEIRQELCPPDSRELASVHSSIAVAALYAKNNELAFEHYKFAGDVFCKRIETLSEGQIVVDARSGKTEATGCNHYSLFAAKVTPELLTKMREGNEASIKAADDLEEASEILAEIGERVAEFEDDDAQGNGQAEISEMVRSVFAEVAEGLDMGNGGGSGFSAPTLANDASVRNLGTFGSSSAKRKPSDEAVDDSNSGSSKKAKQRN